MKGKIKTVIFGIAWCLVWGGVWLALLIKL